MTTAKSDPAIESHPRERPRLPYCAPKLEVLGSLRSVTRGTGGMNFDGNNFMRTMMMSDPRVKEDIVKVGQHPLGLGIYRYRYKAPYAEWYGTGRHVGVMADEVAEKYPDAVCCDANGYLSVDYGRLFH